MSALQIMLPPWPKDEFISRTWHLLISLAALWNINNLRNLNKVKPITSDPKTLCCAIFTFVCAFRSFVPRVDAERLCFWDLGLISTPFIGRSCATVAEIAFAYQFTRYWQRVVSAAGLPGSMFIANVGWFLCSFAQGLCWTGVLTTNNFWHACENSLWGLSPFLLSVGALWAITKPTASEANRNFLRCFCVMGPAFVTYLAVNDVPMYIEKWRQGVGGGVDLHPIDGLWDSMTCNVSRKDDLWGIEYLWMTGYFVGGVWISIQLEHMDEFFVGAKKRGKSKAKKEKKVTTPTTRSTRSTPAKSRARSKSRSKSRSKKD
ncbi:hypothetical protein TL16_g09282 [Triparma laevis f. inornata]|uniref:Uncharacterized protein n=1 Tax=Triparma laevis f. inornata TaxID=1714386 RepID=A0A9W7BAD3_9STRA|nr:hypothetical protein TL16_g09282 [Triparma laevis f. inornata]